MTESVWMAELSWPEFKARVANGAPVFIPLGATEQHGPHLPLGVDVYLPSGVAERVAREVGGVVAPAIPYGYKSQPRSGGGEDFPGTISLDAHTFSLVLRDVIRGFGMDGAHRIVVVNGHFENCWPAVEGIDLGIRELRRDGVTGMQVMRFEYWDFVGRDTHDKLFPDGFPGTELEHASLLETSLMLAMRPDLVEMAKVPADGPADFPNYDRTPFGKGLVPASGVLADARPATVEKGELLLSDHISRIVAAVRKEFGL